MTKKNNHQFWFENFDFQIENYIFCLHYMHIKDTLKILIKTFRPLLYDLLYFLWLFYIIKKAYWIFIVWLKFA